MNTPTTRSPFRLRILASILGGAVALLGLVFFSFGVAWWISARLGSPPAGFLIVGAFYIVAGIVVMSVVGRRGGSSGSR